MNHYITIAMLSAALGWAAPAAAQGAQKIYRCGNSYSQQPCADGKLVAASDSRSAAQKAQTDEATKRVTKAADAMEKARVKDEARPAPVGLPAATPDAAPKDAKKPDSKPQSKMKKPEHFTAVAPKKPGDEPVRKKAKKKDA